MTLIERAEARAEEARDRARLQGEARFPTYRSGSWLSGPARPDWYDWTPGEPMTWELVRDMMRADGHGARKGEPMKVQKDAVTVALFVVVAVLMALLGLVLAR